MKRIEYEEIINRYNFFTRAEKELLLQAYDIGRDQGLEEAKEILNKHGKNNKSI